MQSFGVIMNKKLKGFCLVVFLTLLLFSLGLSGSVGMTQQVSQEEEPSPDDSLHADHRAKLQKQRREDEFRKLKEDTERLHQAAGELKEMIEQSTPHTFSLQILKKIDEVEKIVKDVKRRAKDGFGT